MRTRRALITGLAATALLGAVAPAVAADLPAPPNEPPPLEQRGTALLRAAANEHMITLRLACHDPGKVTLATVAPKRRLGTTRFACNRGRAIARMRMPRRTPRSLEAVATVVSDDEHSTFELKTTRGEAAARLADVRIYVPPAWCTGIGFTMSIDNRVRFDAEWGETVWWQPMALERDLRTGAGTWRYVNYWRSHRAVPGEGYFLRDPSTGRLELTWTVTQSGGYVASRYGVTVFPAYQVYTNRGGYRSYWLATQIAGEFSDDQLTDRCIVPYV
jgi:hypothetical protein